MKKIVSSLVILSSLLTANEAQISKERIEAMRANTNTKA